MNIILPGESGISKYDEDSNSPLYTEDKDIVMTKDEKKHWMAGDDVPVIQATNPWSMQVDDTNVDKDFYKQSLEMPQQPADQILTLGKADFNQNINNVASILRDILAGDQKAMERPEFQALNFPAIKAYLEWAIKTNTLADAAKGDLMNNAWRLNFKCRPPTPNEFLQEKFIGAQAEALHKPLIDIFCEFFDPLKPYRTLVLTQCIGWGKSTLSTLAQLYISVHYAMMWHPYRFFGMAMSSIFTQCLGGWNQKKASELLLEPFTQILEGAPYFQRVRTHQDLVDASAEDISDCIHWTTSTPTAQPLDSKIIMSDGSVKLMGDIQIGDKVKSPSEGTTEVINIPYHGVADCYEIELEDGRTVRCSAEHLWNVRRTPESDWEVVNLQYIMDHPEYDWEIRELDDF